MDDTERPRVGWRKTASEERMLRQFMSGVDGPKGQTDAYREGWDRIFGEKKEGPSGVHTQEAAGREIHSASDIACTIEDICTECGYCEACGTCQCE